MGRLWDYIVRCTSRMIQPITRSFTSHQATLASKLLILVWEELGHLFAGTSGIRKRLALCRYEAQSFSSIRLLLAGIRMKRKPSAKRNSMRGLPFSEDMPLQ